MLHPKNLLMIIWVTLGLPIQTNLLFAQTSPLVKEWEITKDPVPAVSDQDDIADEYSGRFVEIKRQSQGLIVVLKDTEGKIVQTLDAPIPGTESEESKFGLSYFTADNMYFLVYQFVNNSRITRIAAYSRQGGVPRVYTLPQSTEKSTNFVYNTMGVVGTKMLVSGSYASNSGWKQPLNLILDLPSGESFVKSPNQFNDKLTAFVEKNVPAKNGWYIFEKHHVDHDIFDFESKIIVRFVDHNLNYKWSDSVSYRSQGNTDVFRYCLTSITNGIGLFVEQYASFENFTKFHYLKFNEGGKFSSVSSKDFSLGFLVLTWGRAIDFDEQVLILGGEGNIVSFNSKLDTLFNVKILKSNPYELLKTKTGGYVWASQRIEYPTANNPIVFYTYTYLSSTPANPIVIQFTDNETNISASLNVSMDGGSPVTAYGVEYRAKGSTNEWTVVEFPSGDFTIPTDPNKDYEFRFYIKNKNGKSTYSQVYVTFRLTPTVSSPDYQAVAKPLEDTVQQNPPTGIVEQAKLDVTLYPNPSSGSLTIETEYSGSIIITDIQGKLVLTNDLYPGKSEINISAGSGIYFYTITTDEGSTSGKIMVRQ